MVERRAAARFRLPPGIEGTVGGGSVRIVDLSAIGARLEHEERFPLASPQLRIVWKGTVTTIPLRVGRSEIVGRRASGLVYQTGLQFVSTDTTADGIVAAIMRLGTMEPPVDAATPEPAQHAPEPSLDDSWIRQVRFRRDEHEIEDSLPYAQFRLVGTQWQKAYVATPDQPYDGFTIRRDALDFHELQKTFESADPETRRMMQIALESQLKRA